MAEPLSIQVTLQAIDKMTAPVREAMGANRELSASLTQTRQRMVELDKAQQAFKGYSKLKEQAGDLASQLATARDKAQALAIAMKNPQPSETLRRSFERTGTQADALKWKLQAAEARLAVVQQKMQSTDQPSERLVAQLAKAKQQVQQFSNKTEQAQAKLTLLSAKMVAANQPSAKLSEQFAKARAEVNRLDQAHLEMTRRLDQTRQRVAEAGIPMRSLTEAQRTLRQQTDQATQALGQQVHQLQRVMTQQQRAAEHAKRLQQLRGHLQDRLQMQQDIGSVAYPALAAGTGLLYGAAKPVMQAANLSDIVKDIAITGNMSNSDEAKLRDDLRQIALKTNQEQSAIGQGVQILVANGMNGKEASQYADILGKTATASRAQMEDVSNVTFSLQNSLKIKGVDAMNQAMNDLVFAGKQGQFELRDMARYFPSLSAQMASMGATGSDAVRELGIAMQAARKASGTSQEAAANMSNWFSHMTSSSTIEHFDKLGIDFKAEMLKRMNETDPNKRMSALRASLDVLDQYIDKLTAGQTYEIKDKKGKVKESLSFKDALKRAADTGSADEVQRIVERFGLSKVIQDMQTANFYLAMRQNKGFIDQSMKAFNGDAARQTLNTDFARRMQSPIEAFKAAKISLQDTLTQVGDTLLPMVTPVVEWITKTLQGVTAWAKANPELTATLLKVAGVMGLVLVGFGGLTMMMLSILGPIAMFRYAIGLAGVQLRWLGLMGQGSRLAGLWSWISSGARTAGSALLWLVRAALTTPIGITLTLLAGAAYLIYRNWDSVVGYTRAKYQQFMSWISTASLPEIVFKISTAPLQIARILATDFFNWWRNTELGQKAIHIGSEMVDAVWGKLKAFHQWWQETSFTEKVIKVGQVGANVASAPVRGLLEKGYQTGQWLHNKLFGGGRATGGSVHAGKFYQVNEVAPELLHWAGKTYLMMGNTGGHVMPMRAAANEERATNVIPLRRSSVQKTSINQNIQITIHAAAGMDEREIARQVAAQLHTQQRRQRYANSSALYDGDGL